VLQEDAKFSETMRELDPREEPCVSCQSAVDSTPCPAHGQAGTGRAAGDTSSQPVDGIASHHNTTRTPDQTVTPAAAPASLSILTSPAAVAVTGGADGGSSIARTDVTASSLSDHGAERVDVEAELVDHSDTRSVERFQWRSVPVSPSDRDRDQPAGPHTPGGSSVHSARARRPKVHVVWF